MCVVVFSIRIYLTLFIMFVATLCSGCSHAISIAPNIVNTNNNLLQIYNNTQFRLSC